MNTDIRLSCGFWSHPKTKRLVKRLGLEGVRSLQILWAWAAQERPSGCLSGMDAEEIELAADWNGEDGRFFGECLGRWIDEGEDGFCLHDWEDHNPWVSDADNRSDAARLSRLARVNKDAAAGLKADGRTGITKDEYRMYAEGTAYERRTTVRSTPAPAPAPTYVKEKDRVCVAREDFSPAVIAALPPSPEDDPDALPASLDSAPIEFQELARVYREIGGYVDFVPAYRAYHAMRHRFPLARIADDLEARKDWDRWKRGIIPNLSNYLTNREWLNPIPAARASPSRDPTQAQTYRQCQDMERRQEAESLRSGRVQRGTDVGNHQGGIGPGQRAPVSPSAITSGRA